MTGTLRAVLLALSMISASLQVSPKVTLVPLGQLDGPNLRHLHQRGPFTCGAFFTFAPTDREGGGTVYFGITRGDLRKYDDDPSNDTEVAESISGLIRPKRCEECQAPMAEQVMEGGSTWTNLYISQAQFELSPCLKKLKFQK